MRRKTNVISTALAVALMTPAAVLAQVDTSDWKCEYCPFDKGYRADYDVGVSNVSGEDGLRFGNGTGYDDEGAYAEVGGEGRYVGDGTEISWTAEDLGLDSRVIEFSAGKPGKFTVDLGYREMPYRLFGSTSTVFTGSDDFLSLPSTWTTAGTTAGFTDLGASLTPRNVESDRQIFELGVAYKPARRVDLYADYRQQQRDGIEIAAGSAFTNSAFLPRVIDDETDTIDAGARFAVGRLNLTLGFYGSYYRNNVGSLTWDNPFTAIPGAEQMQMALEPDNDFQQFLLSGVFRADAMNTVVAFSAAAGRSEQSDELLPVTINPNFVFPAVVLPPLDAKVDTTNYALTVTSKPFSKARVKLAYRFDERDNRTPISTWSRVIADSFASGDIEQNIPYSYERARLNLSGSYKLFDTVIVSAGYDRTDLDRDFQEVASQTEDSGWGKLRWRPTPYLEATFKGGTSRREVDEYDTDLALSLGQNPLMRKYYLAYRFREFAEVGLSASIPERPVSVGMSYLYADDSYSQSELGMTESEERRFTFDVSWAPSENSSIYLTAGNESIDATQIGSETFTGPVWAASHDDDFNHAGGGFTLFGLADKVDLVLDYSHSEGDTEVLYSGPAVSATPLPELESTRDSLRFTLSYNWSDRLSGDFIVRYESFETADWALDGVLPDTIPTVLTMGASSYDYDVWAIGVGIRFRAGE